MHFRNPESSAGLLISILFLLQYKLPNVQSHLLTMSSLKKKCFKNMYTETPLGEFDITLVLVIFCEPVTFETESRNFSALEAQCVYIWQ